MYNIFIGIDNGVSGSVGVICGEIKLYVKIPVKKVLNYTKSKQFLHRIDCISLNLFLFDFSTSQTFCMIERPMINPIRFKASVSAIRAMEATMIVLELLKIPYEFIDSKQWQKALLPAGLEKEELKVASLDVGKRLFPQVNFDGFADADGLMIAEFCKRMKK